MGEVLAVAKKYIPREYRREYIPGWNEHCKLLYDECNSSDDSDIADDLLHSLGAVRNVFGRTDIRNKTSIKQEYKTSIRLRWDSLFLVFFLVITECSWCKADDWRLRAIRLLHLSCQYDLY